MAQSDPSTDQPIPQPIGAPVAGWTPRAPPPRTAMLGRFCRVEPLSVLAHGHDLFAAFSLDAHAPNWTYLSVGPFADFDAFRAWLEPLQASADPLVHVIVDAQSGKAVGMANYLRIDRGNGVIEIGSLIFSPLLQRTPAATEAMFLMLRRAFDELGYRRYEWKCDSLNAPSRAAALRLGFTFEGIFRQAVVYKGRSRDTAWYSIVDREWPRLRVAFEAWLSMENFGANGVQIQSLRDLIIARK